MLEAIDTPVLEPSAGLEGQSGHGKKGGVAFPFGEPLLVGINREAKRTAEIHWFLFSWGTPF